MGRHASVRRRHCSLSGAAPPVSYDAAVVAALQLVPWPLQQQQFPWPVLPLGTPWMKHIDEDFISRYLLVGVLFCLSLHFCFYFTLCALGRGSTARVWVRCRAPDIQLCQQLRRRAC